MAIHFIETIPYSKSDRRKHVSIDAREQIHFKLEIFLVTLSHWRKKPSKTKVIYHHRLFKWPWISVLKYRYNTTWNRNNYRLVETIPILNYFSSSFENKSINPCLGLIFGYVTEFITSHSSIRKQIQKILTYVRVH